MPSPHAAQTFAEWLATPPIEGMLVATAEFSGIMLKQPVLICNRRHAPLVAKDEFGVDRMFQPLGFTMTYPAMRGSTESTVQLRIDAVDGLMLRTFAQVESDALNNVLNATIRIYVDPVLLDRPAWGEPLRLRVESMKIGLDVVEMLLVGGRLPNKRAGHVYDLARFVGLRPF
jgi:hypothetical protein